MRQKIEIRVFVQRHEACESGPRYDALVRSLKAT